MKTNDHLFVNKDESLFNDGDKHTLEIHELVVTSIDDDFEFVASGTCCATGTR